MTQIQFTNAARQDLKNIFSYTIHTWGKPQAQKYSEQLKQHVKKIAQNAAFCKPVLHGQRNLKQSTVGRHLIISEQTEDKLLIVRILHEAMDIPRHISSAL